MEYAIVKTGGKQYKVSKGTVLEVDRLDEKGKEIILDEVLLFSNDGQVRLGKPNLPDVKVKATIIDDFKGEKIRVSKFKSKVRYRRVMGFRAHMSRLEIKDIISGKEEKVVKVSPVSKIKKTNVKKSPK
ncbi:MAG: 50S ribosomal protein L21 [Patescibacteria group bacterium]